MDYLIRSIRNLRPNAEFSFIEDDYSTIAWDVLEGEAPTQQEVEAEIDRMKKEEKLQEQYRAEAKAALLERLGITEDEAKLLLS